ncbi:DUF5131 family protein [Methyloversatilis discipulorum]|uniref:DUF5131 family protein n=1 Tax=Methyloversatilis discipulorum TaxID=1119528 RepID=UPI00036C26B0|nr:phage Gp37/Gp68 family protein [Methyloversatilis discipulorum]
MSDKTGIEWTDATWNPVTGCAKVSQGCKHCYAEREWPRMTKLVPAYSGRDFTDVLTHGDRLAQPIRWAKRRMIFVNSMSDLFHPAVPDDFIDSVFGVMWACLYGRNEHDGHIFQVLTKRADRMRDYFRTDRREAWARSAVHHGGGIDPDGIWDQTMNYDGPHPRIWLGVSIEDQSAADERIPLLLDTPAAVRWISAEPMLGPIDLTAITVPRKVGVDVFDSLYYDGAPDDDVDGGTSTLDWVICGGESGPHARPMHPHWARDLRDQCAAAGVPFLFKQWGEFGPTPDDWRLSNGGVAFPEGSIFAGMPSRQIHCNFDDYATSSDTTAEQMLRVGKKAAGRLLDGRTHDEFPETRS